MTAQVYSKPALWGLQPLGRVQLHQSFLWVIALLWVCSSFHISAQTPAPDQGVLIDNGLWTADTHFHRYANTIIASSAGSPLTITAAANSELISGTQVRLTENFHAGGFGTNGHFRAWIDPSQGTAADLVLIAPDPTDHLINGVMHVEKWEKLELGLKPPVDFINAINTFFDHYYSNGITAPATPVMVDPQHDLNPYADDSLQLVMRLTSPTGVQKMKWGFFMRESMWATTQGPLAELDEDPTDPLYPYHFRFRIAPDEVGTWNFSITVNAPHTTNANGLLYPITFANYSFVCDPPLPDNKGHLRVNQTNKRTLQFETDEPFFGLGTNMADASRRYMANPQNDAWYSYYQRDFDIMKQTMEDLHSVGGNYMRMFLMRHIFAPEWINLGVYDQYAAQGPCNGGGGVNKAGNCQYQSWAFDQMLDHARLNNIYIQLCIDPYIAGNGYETFLWGSHAYVAPYLETERDATGLYDVKKIFYTEGDQTNTDSGVFYYWKRKYKYIMSRWGYSVNIAAIEPFNEINQMLTYDRNDLTNAQVHNDICLENTLVWEQDTELPITLNYWLTDMTNYVRGNVDLLDPVSSPLGETDKLFLMSYTDAMPPLDPVTDLPNSDYYLPFINPNVDLLDVHKYYYRGQDFLKDNFEDNQSFRDNYLTNGNKKPFQNGEKGTWGEVDHDNNSSNDDYSTCKVFSNYDVSFHNELWASTFNGSFTTGLTWLWDRVFWWPDAMPNGLPHIPFDQLNPDEQIHSGVLGNPNILRVTPQLSVSVVNKTVYHNFNPLHNLLSNPNWQGFEFFNGNYSPNYVRDYQNKLEAYYLLADDGLTAVGWIHNINAFWENQYYLLAGSHENFLGCSAPTIQQLVIPDLQSGMDFFVSFFSTRMNTTEHPTGYLDQSGTGDVLLDLSTAPFTGIANNYLDTLHSDYAFIIALNPVPKSLTVPTDTIALSAEWDFKLFPNPTSTEVNLLLPNDEVSKDIVIYDLSGKRIRSFNSWGNSFVSISTAEYAKGAYCVRVSDDRSSKMKTLVIQ